MSLDAALDAVPDRTDGQFALESPEGGFYFGELHVLTPESVGVHGIEIGAQEIGALTQAWLRADEPYSKTTRAGPFDVQPR